MKRILVADDSVTIQKVIALTFADEPFEVQSVGTGSEALEVAKNWKPDIVLADVIMPQMNGYELCRAIKQQEETSSVPVLLLAGTFEAFDEEEASSVGADDFITKPFESGELIEKVRTLTGVAASAAPAEPVTAVDAAPEPAEPDIPVPPPPPAEAPSAQVQEQTAEPDIWDILSESGDSSQELGGDAQAPGFGPIEGEGVVDVGSFDVGIERPEPEPAPPWETEEPIPAAGPPSDTVSAPPTPLDAQEPSEIDEKSRVENMEKDFFGFETGAVEEATSSGVFDDAVEEVTFEMEQPPAATEPDAQEASFVIPEAAEESPPVTGETISPELMAPEAPTAAEPAITDLSPEIDADKTVPETAPADVPETQPIDIPEITPVPEPEPSSPGMPGEEPVPEPLHAPEAPLEMELAPEEPLELPVDLTSDLPIELNSEPSPPPLAESPSEAHREIPVEPSVELKTEIEQEPGPDIQPTAPAPAEAVVPDDEAIRKIVEEKVEKIAWEVVPEMAEVIIREAIQKIKDGT